MSYSSVKKVSYFTLMKTHPSQTANVTAPQYRSLSQQKEYPRSAGVAETKRPAQRKEEHTPRSMSSLIFSIATIFAHDNACVTHLSVKARLEVLLLDHVILPHSNSSATSVMLTFLISSVSQQISLSGLLERPTSGW